MTFEPGKSGNPAGRPKGAERIMRDLIKAQTAVRNGADVDGWQRLTLHLFAIAMGEIESSRRDQIAAAKLLFERAFGYPKQDVKIEETSSNASPALDLDSLTIEERREALGALRRLEELAGRGVTEH